MDEAGDPVPGLLLGLLSDNPYLQDFKRDKAAVAIELTIPIATRVVVRVEDVLATAQSAPRAAALVAGPLALLCLPLLEISWDTASTFKLNRYTYLQHALLKKLQQNAPGTYQHSMTVAHLAQVVGEAIGANSLLLRIGAYYHDIGNAQKQ